MTAKGGHFSSRVSASILNAIGLAELITNDIGEYEELAVDIANNPEKLQALKKKVETNRLTAPLFDTPQFTRNLERAYREMVKIAKRGESPKQIDVQQLD